MSVTTVPLSDLTRRTTEVTRIAAHEDVILSRRDAADLYLSTRERHEREATASRITTTALATLASTRPDIAGEALTATLPWMAWLPTEEKIQCLEELLSDLRAGAETGQLKPFSLSLAAWTSTAIAWAEEPGVRRSLESADAGVDGDVVRRPGA